MKFEEWIKGIENAAIKGLCSTHPNICKMIYNEGQKDIEKALKEKGVCLQSELDEANAQIEKMKCCYNCSKWYDGECEESPKSKTFFCADFKCDKWEVDK